MGHFNPGRLKELFSNGLPGKKAQNLMAPEFRGAYEHDGNPVRAAVLALLYPYKGTTWIAFMKRNAYDGPHSAQVSFPGGAWEPTDKSLEATALRETREELGINGEIEILGSMTELHIPVSNFLVTPFAGGVKERPKFNPDPSEVQYVIEASLEELLDPSNIKWDTWQHHDRTIAAPYYSVGSEKIWGATAMMLCEFLQVAAR
jgi:8-oxo-dGTP pyrophosphatase MutT (NUDIX family)